MCPVGGVIVVFVVVVVGVPPGVVLGVVVVDVSLIGVPFLRPVTIAVASEPKNENASARSSLKGSRENYAFEEES